MQCPNRFWPRIVILGVTLICVLWCAPAFGTGDINTANCANELLTGFSTAFPECRAYEQVSPPFKGGQRVGMLATAASGSQVIVESFGTFGGANGDSQNGEAYELSRGSTGWTASAIGAPASRFSTETLLDGSALLDKTVWATREPAQSIYAKDIYLREPDGLFKKVGSMVPPGAEPGPAAGGYGQFLGGYSYAGASSDLSHLLLSISGFSALWPGDTTEHTTTTSLYEYAGTENTAPQLVGLSNESRLISNCGTVLGLEEQDTYNAISTNGRTVFFTALGHNAGGCEASATAPEVSELYARVAETETVPISEPSPTQCAECNTAVRSSPEFRGASQDGSKVFFTTEQDLLPGAATSNLYEYNFHAAKGAKVLRVSAGTEQAEVLGVARVSEDGSHVYFVARGVLTTEPDPFLAPGHATAVAGQPNLYLFEQNEGHPGGHVRFVATLAEGDGRLWGAIDNRPVQATPDGGVLVFVSEADLTPGDTSNQPQVFLYDAGEGNLVRVSTGQQGYSPGELSALQHQAQIPIQIYRVQQSSTQSTNLALTSDGHDVLFQSSGALTPSAVGAAEVGASSVYLYHRSAPQEIGNVYLLAAGRSGLSASATGLDADGTDAFFETVDQPVAADGDTQYDIYDARVNGGFATTLQQPCEGEACHSFPLPPEISGSQAPTMTVVPEGSVGPVAPAGRTGTKGSSKRNRRALGRALRRCRREKGSARRHCEAKARHRYSSASGRRASGSDR
jgi:hypothetical protein